MSRRWAFFFGALFIAELLALLGSFSTAGMPREAEGWMRWMSRTNVIPQVAIAFATVVLLFARRETKGATQVDVESARPRRIRYVLAAQLASFVVLYGTSWQIFTAHLEGSRYPELWVAAWSLSALSTCVFGALCCLPASSLVAIGRRHAPFLCAAVVLAIAAWAAGEFVAHDLRLALRGPTLWLVADGLRLFRDDIITDYQEFIVGAKSFAIRIAPNCSGFEGIGLSLVFVSAYLGVFRRELRFPRALLLPVLAAFAAWCSNVLRLGGLILLGISGWPELAVNGFHSIAGTATFCCVALGTVALSRRSSFFSATPRAGVGEEFVVERDATAAYLLPFLLAMAVGMVSSVFGGTATIAGVASIAVVAGTVFYFRSEIAFGPARGWLLAALGGAGAAVAWLGLGALVGSAASQELELPSTGFATVEFTMRLLSYLVMAPIAEELAFRGYLMRRLSQAEWSAISPRQVSMVGWLLSSLAFGMLHEHWSGAVVAGALYGLVYLRSGSLLAAILAHAFTNALLAAHALVFAPTGT